MSYASVGSFSGVALGAIDTWCPSAPGGAGKQLANCNGTERATNCPSVCCDPGTWNNGTYVGLKGSASLQRWNEIRVRNALLYLLSPTPTGDPSPAEALAWDASATIAGNLLIQLQRALANFDVLFPQSRWKQKQDCKPSDCSSTGFWSCWYQSPPSPSASQLSLLKQLTGDAVSAEQWVGAQKGFSKLLPGLTAQQAQPLPAAAQQWYDAMMLAIRAVPGGGGSYNYQTTVKPGSNVKPDPAYLVISGGTVSADKKTIMGGAVVPSPWLASLISLLVPASFLPSAISPALVQAVRGEQGQIVSSADAIRKMASLLRGPASTLSPLTTGGEQERTVTGSTASGWYLLGAALLVGGGAYYFMRR